MSISPDYGRSTPELTIAFEKSPVLCAFMDAEFQLADWTVGMKEAMYTVSQEIEERFGAGNILRTITGLTNMASGLDIFRDANDSTTHGRLTTCLISIGYQLHDYTLLKSIFMPIVLRVQDMDTVVNTSQTSAVVHYVQTLLEVGNGWNGNASGLLSHLGSERNPFEEFIQQLRLDDLDS